MRIIKALLIIISFLLAYCDHGIAPDYSQETAGFSGTVTFLGQWPDSVKRTHIVVFENPLLTEADFNAFNLRYVSNEIPFGVKTYEYSSLDTAVIPVGGLLPAGTYSYVAVAQSFTEEVSLERKDWVVAGVYYSGDDTTKPGTLVIPENTLVDNINIICDFNNPPPQPPGGEP
ncbi:MAG: hypothetical protein Kow0098_18110 [Ignavibacteriaceae bacterium]